jgi:hypothetical protein
MIRMYQRGLRKCMTPAKVITGPAKKVATRSPTAADPIRVPPMVAAAIVQAVSVRAAVDRRIEGFYDRFPWAAVAVSALLFALSVAICVAAVVDWDWLFELTPGRAPFLVLAAIPVVVMLPWATFRTALPRWRRTRHARAVAAGYAEAETLAEVLGSLDRRRGDLMIYAERPWRPASRALVLDTPEQFDFDPPELAPSFHFFMFLKQARYDAQFFPDDPVDGLIRLASQPPRKI